MVCRPLPPNSSSFASCVPRPCTAGVLSESRAAGQVLVYRRNEQLQTGPAVAQDQEGMELEEGGHDEHQVGVCL